MPFNLSRGGNNVPVEVQRWQYFLTRLGFGGMAGRIDGRFGQLTEDGTKAFQIAHGLAPSGAVDTITLQAAATQGYTILPDDHYTRLSGGEWPPEPTNLRSPSNAARNAALSCFVFSQLPLANRREPEQIEMGGSCDGATSDWEKTNIVRLPIGDLAHVQVFPGYFRCHKLIAPALQALIAAWKDADLLHLLTSFAGGYYPRYIRKTPLDPAGHGPKRSTDVSKLSNHSFGSAFDFNAPENPLGAEPKSVFEAGSVRELAPIAVRHGFYWGGWFSRRDGMHFEFADFDGL
jgi:hypothetical protein